MKQWIIADSCCDLKKELRDRLGAITVPLSITIGEKTFIDDEKLNMKTFMKTMQSYTGQILSSCPSPADYRDAFLKAREGFVVTLSKHVSGSYQSALHGKKMAEEQGARIHVFDSKSASAGEVLIALKIRKLIEQGQPREYIIEKIEDFIKKMKTYSILEKIDHLVRNGRLHKITGKVISILNIYPILGSDGDGNIAHFSSARGKKQAISKLIDLVGKSERPTKGQELVITHCNNIDLAEQIKKRIVDSFEFAEILIVPTRGISSMYANEGGIVLAF